jgi:sugar phosphate isomerase/epimerase
MDVGSERPALKLGVIFGLGEHADDAIRKVAEMGLPTCQVAVWDGAQYSLENGKTLRSAPSAGVEITTIWAGWPGRRVWNFVEGPTTIGIVPETTREARVAALKRGADFAVLVKVPSITTHAGFIPESPSDPLYPGVVAALREVAQYCQERSLEFWLETGQETPVTLLRAIQDIGLPNVGLNYDPANLLMYGKANPLDALDLVGHLVRGVHAKDGEYPTNGRELGVEKPLGEGRVNFPALIGKLRALGFAGAVSIEREISGARQLADIRSAAEFLAPLCA